MSSSDRATGLSGSTCEWGSISGTASRAVVRSRTRVSDDMGRLPDGSWQFFPISVLQRPAKITNGTAREWVGTRPRPGRPDATFFEASALETGCARAAARLAAIGTGGALVPSV